MLKDLFFRLIDLLDAVLFEPFRLENTFASWGDYPLKIAKVLVLLLASLSVAAGNILISPPFSSRSIGLLISSFILFLGFFSLLPYPLAYIIDGLAQKKDRKANAKSLFHTVRIGISVFITYGAWAIFLSLLGLGGKVGVLLLYLIHYGLFFIIVIRATMYLYDLKFRDALSFNITTFVITFFFPPAMYFTLGISFAASSQ
ncbi:hypothetical protein EHQ27_14835 [Leptospira wolffii]|nr:hypothetical protein EHQ32_05365 [Leptospira wolffii]TGK68253.1 hypothetical protein EHQ27_14835 [Leptospira wolffii]TGK74871.1 hypothetical protein EHQ35_08410 [Leptospira wolffii]TGL32272.1 hypothetical protein EHQ57_04265 [Leptospira wolffii]